MDAYGLKYADPLLFIIKTFVISALPSFSAALKTLPLFDIEDAQSTRECNQNYRFQVHIEGIDAYGVQYAHTLVVIHSESIKTEQVTMKANFIQT